MQKFIHKKKLLVLEAVKLTEDNVDVIANWTGAQIIEEKDALSHETFEALNIKTPGGIKRASQGMYVAKFDGHFFVASAGNFESLYSPFEPIKKVERVEDFKARQRAKMIKDPFEGMTRFGEGPKP